MGPSRTQRQPEPASPDGGVGAHQERSDVTVVVASELRLPGGDVALAAGEAAPAPRKARFAATQLVILR